MKNDLLHHLNERGLIEDMTSPELNRLLESSTRLYIGIDPTADTLHLGHLVGVVVMRWFQMAGHQPVMVVGGATGLVGDPSGKSKERPLLDQAAVDANVKGIQKSLERILPKATYVNNHDWLGKMGFIEFLRDVGKHFRMGPMLGKEMVRTRLASDEGMSYTEFTYQILQAYDFYHLYKDAGVVLQIGGSDQWGNITAGTELIRKLEGGAAYGLTFPLLTRSDGKKFGKSEEGAIWLSKERCSPYDFYQYLVRVPDGDVIRLMKMLTFLDLEEIHEWERRMESEPHVAQKRLAEVLTEWIHGKEGVATALKVTDQMGPGGHGSSLDAATLEAVAGDMLSAELSGVVGMSLLDLLVATDLVKSKGEARRLIRQKGVSLNNEVVEDEAFVLEDGNLIEEKLVLVGLGKKKKLLVRVKKL